MARTHDHPTINTRIKGATHGEQRPHRIVIHTTESANRPGMSDVLAIPAFWKRQNKGYNAHLVMDGEGLTAKCAFDNQICWAVAGSNTGSLHIELIGTASYSKSQWRHYDKGLKQAAKWCAYWCETHNIPIKLSVNNGIGTHAMHSKAFGISDHTDPGINFPLQEFMRRVHYYHEEGWLVGPNV
jgi:hypothetical protein